jgi:hypothetical protein
MTNPRTMLWIGVDEDQLEVDRLATAGALKFKRPVLIPSGLFEHGHAGLSVDMEHQHRH